MYNKTTPAAATRAPQPSIIQAIVRPILLMTTDPFIFTRLRSRGSTGDQSPALARRCNSGSLAKFTVLRQPFNDLVIDCDDVATIMMRGYKIVIPPIGGATRRGEFSEAAGAVAASQNLGSHTKLPHSRSPSHRSQNR